MREVEGKSGIKHKVHSFEAGEVVLKYERDINEIDVLSAYIIGFDCEAKNIIIRAPALTKDGETLLSQLPYMKFKKLQH